MKAFRIVAIAASAVAIFPASAQGPGLGNLTYAPGELFQPIAVVQSPGGHGNVAMVNGYLMVVYSSDGGGTAEDAGIEFWDVSDPRNPSLVKSYDNADTHGLREPHGMGFSNGYAGDLLVAQAIEGIQFWDVSDPLNISLLDYMDLPGITQGDYTGDWWVFWQAPWVYVAGTNNGLYVVDATDPTDPLLVRQVLTHEMAGIGPGLVFALGNLLVLADEQQAGYVTMDIGDPANPTLIQGMFGYSGYSHLFAAGKILTSGGDGDPAAMAVHDVGHDGSITFVGAVGSGLGNGGYGSYQDGFFHSGFSNVYAKFDIAGLTQLGTGSSGLAGRDEDFGHVLGNLVWVGNDHGQGSALIVHQTAADTTGPDVHWVHPAEGAVDQPATSRVGVSMSDHVDLDSVDSTTFVVRTQGGAALAGKYSVQMGLVNFSPDLPLAPQTTYEVVVDGMRDLAGNTGGTFASTFTTGNLPTPLCTLGLLAPVEVGTLAALDAESVSGIGTLSYVWDFGDGSAPTAPASSSATTHVFGAPGRFPVTLTVENESASSVCSSVQIVHTAPTIPLAVASSPIVPDGIGSVNVNPDNDTVTAIGAGANKLWETRVGRRPRTVARAPNGELWVTNQDDASISVLAANGTVLQTIPLPFASQPYGIVFRPDGSAAYVTLQATGQLVELDPLGNVVASAPVGPQPRGIAVTGDSSRILVTRFVSPADRGEVREIDPASLAVLRTFDLQFDPGPDTEAGGRGVPNYVTSLAISPDGTRALVPSKKDNVARGLFRDGQALTFESRTRTIVSTLDLVANAEDLAARVDLNDRDMAQAIVFSPLGDLVFVATQGTNTVEVLDSNDGSTLASLNTQLAPQGLALDANGSRLFVHNFMSRSVSVFDTSELISAANDTAQLVGHASTVATETLSSQVLAGKRIFYNAADPRMSRDGYISCAGCHLDGGSDGQAWDFTQVGEGLRNTIALTGRAGTGHGNVHWTANFDEIQDFEHDIRTGFAGTGFLSDPDFAATSDPLGNPKAGLSAELDALAAYVSSLGRFPDSPFREADGSLTTAGFAGREIFFSLGCASCHAGDNFTDGMRHDVGTIDASSGMGSGQPLTGVGFETPTLKGIWDTPPYLHNGQAAILEEVLDSAVHGGSDALSASERSELAAYLRQIDDNESAADSDLDGVFDVVDNCPEDPNAGQADGDGDGRGDPCDCASADPTTFAVPGEVAGLVLHGDGTLAWSSQAELAGSGVTYDVYRESESGQPVGAALDGSCIVTDLAATSTLDVTGPPLAGSSYRYLVRGVTACGAGTWGAGSVDPRNVTEPCLP